MTILASTPATRSELEEVCFILSSLITPADWSNLSTRQKDILADAIDRTAARIDAAEGIDPTDELAYLPEPRPWRENPQRQSAHDEDQQAA